MAEGLNIPISVTYNGVKEASKEIDKLSKQANEGVDVKVKVSQPRTSKGTFTSFEAEMTRQVDAIMKATKFTKIANEAATLASNIKLLNEENARFIEGLRVQQNLLTADAKAWSQQTMAVQKGLSAVQQYDAEAGRQQYILAEQLKAKQLSAKAEAMETAAYREAISVQQRAIETIDRLSGAKKKGAEATATTVAEVKTLTEAEKQQEAVEKELARAKERLLKAQAQLHPSVVAVNKQIQELTGSNKRSSAAWHLANQATTAFRATLQGLQANIGIYTSGTIVAAAASYKLAQAIKDTLKTGIEFTAEMSRTRAITKSSGEAYARMEDEVLRLGEVTQKTSTEVAKGLTELGMAGLNASEAVSALGAVLRLSIIGAMDFGQAADIATNVMMAFHVEAKNLATVVDVMAQAATDSNLTVQQLGTTMSYAAPVAQAFGVSLYELTAAAEMLANAGIKASRGGTTLRRTMETLYAPTEQGAKALMALGVSTTDLVGNVKPLEEVLVALSKATDGASKHIDKLKNIVGRYALSGFLQLVSAVSDAEKGMGHFKERLIESAGAAEVMARVIADNLSGDVKQLQSAIERVQLSVFKENEGYLRDFVRWLTTAVREFGRAPGAAEKLTKSVLELVEAIGWLIGAGALFGLWNMIKKVSVGMQAYTLAVAESAAATAAAGAAAGAATGAFALFTSKGIGATTAGLTLLVTGFTLFNQNLSGTMSVIGAIVGAGGIFLLAKGIGASAVALMEATKAAGFFTAAMTVLSRHPILAAISAISAALVGLSFFFNDTSSSIDLAKQSGDRATDTMEKQRKEIEQMSTVFGKHNKDLEIYARSLLDVNQTISDQELELEKTRRKLEQYQNLQTNPAVARMVDEVTKQYRSQKAALEDSKETLALLRLMQAELTLSVQDQAIAEASIAESKLLQSERQKRIMEDRDLMMSMSEFGGETLLMSDQIDSRHKDTLTTLKQQRDTQAALVEQLRAEHSQLSANKGVMENLIKDRIGLEALTEDSVKLTSALNLVDGERVDLLQEELRVVNGQIDAIVKQASVYPEFLANEKEILRVRNEMAATGPSAQLEAEMNKLVERRKILYEDGTKAQKEALETLYASKEILPDLLTKRETLEGKITSAQNAQAEALKKQLDLQEKLSLQDELTLETLRKAQAIRNDTSFSAGIEDVTGQVAKYEKNLDSAMDSLMEFNNLIGPKNKAYYEEYERRLKEVNLYAGKLGEQRGAYETLRNLRSEFDLGYKASLEYERGTKKVEEAVDKMHLSAKDAGEALFQLEVQKNRILSTGNKFSALLFEWSERFLNLDAVAADWLSKFSDAVADFVSGSKDAFSDFFSYVKRSLIELTSRAFIVNIAASLGFGSGMLGVGAAGVPFGGVGAGGVPLTGGGLGQSFLGLGSIISGFGKTVSGITSGLTSLFSGGFLTNLGAGFGATSAYMTAAGGGIGGYFGAAGNALSYGGAALGGGQFAAAIGAMAPYLLPIAAGITALVKIFSDKTEPRLQLIAQGRRDVPTGFEDSVYVKTAFVDLGLGGKSHGVDAKEFVTLLEAFKGVDKTIAEIIGDTSVAKIREAIETSWDDQGDVILKLGQFKLDGKTEEEINQLFGGMAKQYYTELFTLGAQTGDILSEVMLTEIEDVSGDFEAVMSSIAEKVAAVGEAFKVLKDYVNSDLIADFSREWDKANRSMSETGRILSRDIREAMADFDGSLVSLQKISALVQERYAYEMQVLTFLRDAMKEIADTATNLKEQIALDVMDDEQRYQYYKGLAEDAYSKMIEAVDPAEIKKFALEALDAAGKAWGVLPDELKVSLKSGFDAFIDSLVAESGLKLDEMEATLASDSEQLRTTIAEFMEQDRGIAAATQQRLDEISSKLTDVINLGAQANEQDRQAEAVDQAQTQTQINTEQSIAASAAATAAAIQQLLLLQSSAAYGAG